MQVYVLGKVEESDALDGTGVIVKFLTPVLDESPWLKEDVKDMLEKNESLRIFGDEASDLTPFIEIEGVTDDGVFIYQGLKYFKKITDVIQLKINEGDIVIDVDLPEKTVDEKYYNDIFFLREQSDGLRTKRYDDGTSLEVLDYFGKTHAEIKLTKVRFSVWE